MVVCAIMRHEPRKSLTDCKVCLSYFKTLIIGLAQGIKPTIPAL